MLRKELWQRLPPGAEGAPPLRAHGCFMACYGVRVGRLCLHTGESSFAVASTASGECQGGAYAEWGRAGRWSGKLGSGLIFMV